MRTYTGRLLVVRGPAGESFEAPPSRRVRGWHNRRPCVWVQGHRGVHALRGRWYYAGRLDTQEAMAKEKIDIEGVEV